MYAGARTSAEVGAMIWATKLATTGATGYAPLVLYPVPFKALLLGMGFFYLRHPRFRGDMPSAGFNFFCRLSSLSDWGL